jgi:histidinol-phosphate aminotransferase
VTASPQAPSPACSRSGRRAASSLEDGFLVVGVGFCQGTSAEEIGALVDATLAAAGLAVADVRHLATVELRAGEPGVRAAAAARGWPVVAHPAAALALGPVPPPSARARAELGTPSVAEAAALAGDGPASLLVPKRKSASATVAVARHGVPQTTAGHPGVPADQPGRHDGAIMTTMQTDHHHDTGAAIDLGHHGDAEATPGLVDLAVNVRTGPPPPWLANRLVESLTGLAAYPNPDAARAAVAARHGRPTGEVLLTAGGAEAFVLLARVLAPRRAVVVHPQFTEPEAALRTAGHPVERVLLDPADGFRFDPAAVPEDADLVVVGNPTNPTSVLHPATSLAALARPGRILVVDEAFADTVPGEPESLAARRDLPGLVVVRSLTKTWGLAGLRIGYLLAAPALVDQFAVAQPLWAVSTPALVAAEACASPVAVGTAQQYAAELAADRDHLLARLAELPGVTVAGTPASSFVLVSVADGRRVREALRERGYAVRRGDTFPGLGPDWLRIAVRDRATTGGFVAALREVLAA